MNDEKRKQVATQCRAVSHMAKALAQINDDYEKLFEEGSADHLIDQVGNRTAHQMETLGNILNGMDAADEQDKWMDAVFKEAQRLWPQGPRK